MLSTSFEFRNKVAQNSKVLARATLTLANGTVRELVGDDFVMGTMTFSDAVSSGGSFDIGAAIINQFQVTLNNYDRRFDDYDFTNSRIAPYIGVELEGGGVEWLEKGRYWIEQPESYGSTIGISALDNMSLLEVPYSEVPTSYPTPLRTIVKEACEHCGVMLTNPGFANGDYMVAHRPEDDALSCLDIVSYAAQASGNFARCASNGDLVIGWYDTGAFEGEDWLDGESFDGGDPYASGAAADGGDFVSYWSGDRFDGGELDANVIAHVHAYSSATVATDDVVITGVAVTAEDESDGDGGEGRSGESALFGERGYVLSIEGNPLVQFGGAEDVAARVGARVAGMRFRPFSASAIGNPAVEAGDPVILTDRLQNQYVSYLTSLTYKVGGYESFACNAETPGRNSAAAYSAATKAYVKARNAIKLEKAARERAMEELAGKLSSSSGLYMSTEPQGDGSSIYYMHDKPTLPESRIVWKLTANAFGISTDGGKTYAYGLDVNGDAILNRIYAVGLDASYLTTGSIHSQSDNGTRWDLEAGVFENAVRNIWSHIETGWSKTLVAETQSDEWDDVLWSDEEPEDPDLTFPCGPVNVKTGRVVPEDGTIILRFHAAEDLSGVSGIKVGFLEEDDALYGTYIDQSSMDIFGGYASGDWSAARHEAVMVVTVGDAFDAEEGDLLFNLIVRCDIDPGRPLGADIAFEAEGVAPMALYPATIPNKHEYPYRVEHYNILNARVEVSPSVLLGLYESHVPVYQFFHRDSGGKASELRGAETRETYIGGVEERDGFLGLIGDVLFLPNGMRVAADGDAFHVGYPNDHGFNDLVVKKNDARYGGPSLELQMGTDDFVDRGDLSAHADFGVNATDFLISCGQTGAKVYRTDTNAGLYFDRDNGIQVQRGHVYAIVNGETRTLA